MPRQTVLGQALFCAVLLGLILPAGECRAAPEDCLASPTGSAPKGQHWYYSLNRASKQKCWFLADEGLKVAHDSAPKPNKRNPSIETHQKTAQPETARLTAPTEATGVQPAGAQQPASAASAIGVTAPNASAGVATAATQVDLLAPSAIASQTTAPADVAPALSAAATTSTLPLVQAQTGAPPEPLAPKEHSATAAAEPVLPAAQPGAPTAHPISSPAVASTTAAGASARLATRRPAYSGRLLVLFGGALSLTGFIGLSSRWLVRRRDVLNRVENGWQRSPLA